MRHVFWLSMLSLVLWTGSARAQGFGPAGGYNPANRPAFSPYLNLLRRDTPLVTNYYGLVRPDINFQNSLQQLATQQGVARDEQAALQNALTLPPTGHASRFLSHSHYFLTTSGQGAGAPFAAPAGPGQAGAGGVPAPANVPGVRR